MVGDNDLTESVGSITGCFVFTRAHIYTSNLQGTVHAANILDVLKVRASNFYIFKIKGSILAMVHGLNAWSKFSKSTCVLKGLYIFSKNQLVYGENKWDFLLVEEEKLLP